VFFLWYCLNTVRGLSHAQVLEAFRHAAQDCMAARPGSCAWLAVKKVAFGMRLPSLLRYWTTPLPGEPPLNTVSSLRDYWEHRRPPYRFQNQEVISAPLVRFWRAATSAYDAVARSRPFRAVWFFGLLGFVLCPLARPRGPWAAFCIVAFFKAVFPVAVASGIPRNFVPGTFFYLILTAGACQWAFRRARACRKPRAAR